MLKEGVLPKGDLGTTTARPIWTIVIVILVSFTWSVLATARAWTLHGPIGLEFDWLTPATRAAASHVWALSVSSESSVDLGLFSVFGQGSPVTFGIYGLTHLGVGPYIISRLLLIVPISVAMVGASVLAQRVAFAPWVYAREYHIASLRFYANRQHLLELLFALGCGLFYVSTGEAYFVIGDGAIPLLYVFMFLPWLLLAAWQVSHNVRVKYRPVRIIGLGLLAGATISTSQLGWIALLCTLSVILLRMGVYSGIGPAIKVTACALLLNAYWIVHLTWVYLAHRQLISNLVGNNSGAEYLHLSTPVAENFSFTSSYITSRYLGHDPIPSLTVGFGLIFILGISSFILVTILGGRKAHGKVGDGYMMDQRTLLILLAALLFCALASGTTLLGPPLRWVLDRKILTPFRGIQHFELFAALFFVVLLAFTWKVVECYGGDGGPRVLLMVLALGVVNLSLPWLSGSFGSPGRYDPGGPRLASIVYSRSDLQKIAGLARAKTRVLNLPSTPSFHLDLNSGRYVSGLDPTLPESVLGITSLTSSDRAAPGTVGEVAEAAYLPQISSSQLASLLSRWDIQEVRLDKRFAAYLPWLNQGVPILWSQIVGKFTTPYFRPDGVSPDAAYYRLRGSPIFALCVTCSRQLSPERNIAGPRIELPSRSGLERVAMTDTGAIRASCLRGVVHVVSKVGRELSLRFNCPDRVLRLSVISRKVDLVGDGISLVSLLGLLCGVVTFWWHRGRCDITASPRPSG